MKFNVKDIPAGQLQKIGLTHEDISKLPPRTYNALLSGERTTLMRLTKVQMNNGITELDAKLSLATDSSGKPEIRLHPVNAYAQNVYNLGPDEIEKLQSGKKKNIPVTEMVNGEEKKLLVYLDKDTNEFVAIDKIKITPPEKINGEDLTEQQKQDLAEGKEIDIKGEKIVIDPTSELGIRSEGNLRSIEWKKSHYSDNELAFDILMMLSGAGNVMLIGHMADLALHTLGNTIGKNRTSPVRQARQINPENLADKELRNAIAKTFPELKDTIDKNQKITHKELAKMIENHLDRPIDMENVNTQALDRSNIGVGQNVIVKNDNATEQKIDQKSGKVEGLSNVSGEHKEDMKDEIKQETPKQKNRMKY